MAKKQSGALSGVFDLRKARVHIEGEEDLLAGLAKLKDRLEHRVAPLTTDPAPDRPLIEFKGAPAGLTADWGSDSTAVFGLQFAYRLLDAIERGDTLAAVSHAFGLGGAAAELFYGDLGPKDVLTTVIEALRLQQARGNGKSAKFQTAQQRQWLRELVAKHDGNKDQATRVVRDLKALYGYKATKPTVIKHARILGVWKNT